MLKVDPSFLKYGTLFIIVHLLLLKSIFDVYFTSPLVHGMTPCTVPLPPPAKRLVLFVADGLRADLLFARNSSTNQVLSPFMHNVIVNMGTWGVSHTRVPTETRPGHVAIIAGIYEDVSAITKGWQENPVEFDSVFNQSSRTYAWGSADVLWMFARGTSADKVNVSVSEDLDFGVDDASVLDEWVFNQVEMMFEKSKHDNSLKSSLSQDKLIFFLHLVGLDVNGHAHRPTSRQYINNIGVVDRGVSRIYTLFEDFYNDSSTTYVYTSDHGMTSWGSHGAGHPHETLTPLVCWGAGVSTPGLHVSETDKILYGELDQHGIPIFERRDVEQADITPLMSTSIGTPFPVNSIGKLPLDYLNTSEHFKAEAIWHNAMSIVNQVEVKESIVSQSTFSFLFRPFEQLTSSKRIDYNRKILTAIHQSEYSLAIKLSRDLIETSLSALKYYHNYNTAFLYMVITSTFLMWIILNILLLTQGSFYYENGSFAVRDFSINYSILIPASLLANVTLLIQNSPLMHYIYTWQAIVLFTYTFNLYRHINFSISHEKFILTLIQFFIVVLFIWIMVLGFHYREVYSIGLLILSLWPATEGLLNITAHQSGKRVSLLWMFTCLIASIFPSLSVVDKISDNRIVLLTGLFVLLAFAYFYNNISVFDTLLTKFQLIILFLCVLNITHVSYSSYISEATHPLNKLISWSILSASLILPIRSSTSINTNLLSVFISFFSCYLLLSTSHECVFVVIFFLLLYLWLILESLIQNRIVTNNGFGIFFLSNYLSLGKIPADNISINFSDIRITIFVIFFGLLGFFGTGNIASVNTFDISSVYRFITLYSPFTMGLLLIIKIGIPLLWVGAVFTLIFVTTNVSKSTIFSLTLIISDIMALHFFFMIRDEGSWLEIGTSISHYVIAMGMILGISAISFFSSLYVSSNTDAYAQHIKIS